MPLLVAGAAFGAPLSPLLGVLRPIPSRLTGVILACFLKTAVACALQSSERKPDQREVMLNKIARANGFMLVTTLVAVLVIAFNHDGILDIPVLGGLSKTALIITAIVGIPAIFERWVCPALHTACCKNQ